jgi:hypothetical protein
MKKAYNLAPTDLLLLQKHIKLGKKHLEQCISSEEMEAIFACVQPSHKTEEALSQTPMEVVSHVVVICNGVLTGTLGFWLGLSSLLHWKALSPPILMGLSLFAFCMGALVGLQAILFRRKMSRNLLDKHKLKELEIRILQEINSKKERELSEEIDLLGKSLEELQIKANPEEFQDPSMDAQKLSLKWISCLPGTDHIRTHLETKIARTMRYEEDVQLFKKIGQKLGDQPLKSEMDWRGWVKSNRGRLITELIPALLGGASSLFVYIGGSRTLTKEAGKGDWMAFLDSPIVKETELVLVGLITLYFAGSFCYRNYKTYLRDRTLAKIDSNILAEEKRMGLLDNHLLKIKECLFLCVHRFRMRI